MEIHLDELKRREYIDMDCVHFEIDIEHTENSSIVTGSDLAIFRKISDRNDWVLTYIMSLSASNDMLVLHEVIDYVPMNSSLTFIASVGLLNIKQQIIEMNSMHSRRIMKLSELVGM